jgi:hypothetical protein
VLSDTPVTDVTCQVANDILVMRITCQSSDYGTLSAGFKIFNVVSAGVFTAFQNDAASGTGGRTPPVARLCTGGTPLPAVDDARQRLAQPCHERNQRLARNSLSFAKRRLYPKES